MTIAYANSHGCEADGQVLSLSTANSETVNFPAFDTRASDRLVYLIGADSGATLTYVPANAGVRVASSQGTISEALADAVSASDGTLSAQTAGLNSVATNVGTVLALKGQCAGRGTGLTRDFGSGRVTRNPGESL